MTQVTTDRLSAALMLDPLVLGDAGSNVVTFGMGGAGMRGGAGAFAPSLEIDLAIFGNWGRR